MAAARYGVIAAADLSGAPREFTVSGFTGDERRALLEWPDRHALFAHLRSLAGPLRVPDLAAHIHALGFSAFPVSAGAFQATPMRHGGDYVGGFFLGGREGGFTDADEETLVLFAQQAAAAIVNARAHRAERRARANLEALVETCPVGVVVLDAASGAPLTFNREARRILAGLHIEGRSEAEVAQVMTCRRADGREETLGDPGPGLFGANRRRTAGAAVREVEVEAARGRRRLARGLRPREGPAGASPSRWSATRATPPPRRCASCGCAATRWSPSCATATASSSTPRAPSPPPASSSCSGTARGWWSSASRPFPPKAPCASSPPTPTTRPTSARPTRPWRPR